MNSKDWRNQLGLSVRREAGAEAIIADLEAAEHRAQAMEAECRRLREAVQDETRWQEDKAKAMPQSQKTAIWEHQLRAEKLHAALAPQAGETPPEAQGQRAPGLLPLFRELVETVYAFCAMGFSGTDAQIAAWKKMHTAAVCADAALPFEGEKQ